MGGEEPERNEGWERGGGGGKRRGEGKGEYRRVERLRGVENR